MATILLLGPFRLDAQNDLLFRGTEPAALGRRPVALLRELVRQPGQLVSKDALIEGAWPGQAIEESNLTVQIAALRRVLGEAPGGDRWIETMPRRGYRFIGPVVTEVENSVTAPTPQADARDPLTTPHAEPRQTSYTQAEPIERRHLNLLPEDATLSDLNPLRLDTLEAQARGDLETGKLWRRVVAVSPVDSQAHEVRSLAQKEAAAQSVENTARPGRAYPLRPEGLPALTRLGGFLERPSRRSPAIIGAAAAVALAIISIAWWLWPVATLFPRAENPPDQATASATPIKTAPSAASISEPLVAPRFSIVVLPFTNLSNDPDQQYFADGITEDLTTDLSRISGMFVISHNSAFTYQGKRVDTKQIGRELGVRYVLEGSVERSGSRVRLNAQLIGAETDAHLWAERFDGDMSDLFALQDEVTRRIAISLELELLAAEAKRPTGNLDALDLVLRGRSMFLRPTSRRRDDEAIGLFQRAVALDPGSVKAQIFLAGALANRKLDGFDSSVANIEQAEALSLQALEAAPRSPAAHFARAQVLRAQGRLDDAISEYEIVLASDRNAVNALANMGRCRMFIGPIEDGISTQLQAIRLSPRDPNIGLWYGRIGEAHLLQSRFEEAILWLEKARGALPWLAAYHADLAAAYALHGDAEQAAAQLTEAQRLSAKYSSIAQLKLSLYRNQMRGARPEIRALFETTYFAGLRKAGMPEQ
jgi:adenylate cyclase